MSKSIKLILEAQERSWWDATKEFGRDFINNPINPFKGKMDRAKAEAERLAAGLKEKTLWDKTEDHLSKNWAAYGTGAAALAAGLGAYKLRQKIKEKKQLENKSKA